MGGGLSAEEEEEGRITFRDRGPGWWDETVLRTATNEDRRFPTKGLTIVLANNTVQCCRHSIF